MKNKQPILISGFIGSGKSTLAKHLAKAYHSRYISGSMIHQLIAKEKLNLQKTKSIAHGFWETTQGRKGTRLRAANLSIDKEVDQRLLQFLHNHPSAVSDARLMPWLYPRKAIRIWLDARENERVKRVAQRDGESQAKVRKEIRARFSTDKKIWKKLYHLDFGKDLHVFDLVLHNDGMTPQQTYRIVKAFLDARFASEK